MTMWYNKECVCSLIELNEIKPIYVYGATYNTKMRKYLERLIWSPPNDAQIIVQKKRKSNFS